MTRITIFLAMAALLMAPQFARAQGVAKLTDNSQGFVASTGGYYLEDLVVSQNTQLENVVYEDDGSVSLLKDDIITALNALDSGTGAAVNFDIAFAKNSHVLTADGKRTVGIIADAIRYMDSTVNIELEVRHSSGLKSMTESRGRELVRVLSSAYGLRNPISYLVSRSAVQPKKKPTSSKQSELWRITVVNMGDIAAN